MKRLESRKNMNAHEDKDDHQHDPHKPEHGHDHGHEHERGREHGHVHGQLPIDEASITRRGMRALLISFLGLLLTAVFQLIVVLVSGSVALLSDTIHNFADASTA